LRICSWTRAIREQTKTIVCVATRIPGASNLHLPEGRWEGSSQCLP
jgi:hypothetical protein